MRRAGTAYYEQNFFSDKIEEYEEYDPDQGARIYRPYITRNHAQAFFKMFWGRQDVYARRGRNGGYFPQCANRWNNYVCPKQHGEKQFCDFRSHFVLPIFVEIPTFSANHTISPHKAKKAKNAEKTLKNDD